MSNGHFTVILCNTICFAFVVAVFKPLCKALCVDYNEVVQPLARVDVHLNLEENLPVGEKVKKYIWIGFPMNCTKTP